MSWIKKLFTNWQYEYNVANSKTWKLTVEELKIINSRLDRLEKFAKESQNYYELVEARRTKDLENNEKKGK